MIVLAAKLFAKVPLAGIQVCRYAGMQVLVRRYAGIDDRGMQVCRYTGPMVGIQVYRRTGVPGLFEGGGYRGIPPAGSWEPGNVRRTLCDGLGSTRSRYDRHQLDISLTSHDEESYCSYNNWLACDRPVVNCMTHT